MGVSINVGARYTLQTLPDSAPQTLACFGLLLVLLTTIFLLTAVLKTMQVMKHSLHIMLSMLNGVHFFLKFLM